MGIGYVIGCLLSVIFWKIDRQHAFGVLNGKLKERLKENTIILQLLYLLLIAAVFFAFGDIKPVELSNLITAFLVIDISNTEKKNLLPRDRVKFYDSISTITRAVVCGFIAPLFYIILFGNGAAVVFMIIYNLILVEDFDILKLLFTAATIIPALIAELFLYIVYMFRNKKYSIDFKGDYFINFFIRPLLNVDILGAYIESVNFYYHYSSKNTDYLKSYGEYSKKIDLVCVKDYLSIGYGICLATYIIFHILLR